MAEPPPPDPKRNKGQIMNLEKPKKEPVKPPTIIRNLDLVEHLTTQTEGSDDEYEAFDEQIIEQNQRKNMSRVGSKQSLLSGHQSSVESVYQTPSVASYEEEDYVYEIYESITETVSLYCYSRV